MLRLSSGLRRYRWAVFVAWLLLLVPSVYLAMSQSDNLTGGGYEVVGSESLHGRRHLAAELLEQGEAQWAR